MLVTYELTDGRCITGDENDIEVVTMKGANWEHIRECLELGMTVINLAHVTHVHKPTDTNLDRYKVVHY